MKIIDKNKLTCAIEKLMYNANLEADIASTGEIFDEKVAATKYDTYKHLLALIESMDTKDVDIERAIDDYVYKEGLVNCYEIGPIAKYFFELGLKTQNSINNFNNV